MPLVDKTVIQPILEDIRRFGGEQFTERMLLFVIEDNPTLAAFIKTVAEASSDELMVSVCAACVYKMLHIQAEANQLST